MIPRGVVLLDKPEGMTSFFVANEVRRKLKAKKAGHAGTLDPMATGLLLIALDEETKNIGRYVGLPKTYEAEILIGERRSTGDREGEIREQKTVSDLQKKEVENALKDMIGTLKLPVPIYSAVKQGGEPLYRKARRGEEIRPPEKLMQVRKAVLKELTLKNGKAFVSVEFEVGSGTYIRSLAEELGRRLGYPATLWNLRRTRIGDFHIEDAKTIEEL